MRRAVLVIYCWAIVLIGLQACLAWSGHCFEGVVKFVRLTAATALRVLSSLFVLNALSVLSVC